MARTSLEFFPIIRRAFNKKDNRPIFPHHFNSSVPNRHHFSLFSFLVEVAHLASANTQ